MTAVEGIGPHEVDRRLPTIGPENATIKDVGGRLPPLDKVPKMPVVEDDEGPTPADEDDESEKKTPPKPTVH